MLVNANITLLDFSTATPIADAIPPIVVNVAITRFLLLSHRRPLRAANNSAVNVKTVQQQYLKIS